MFLTLCLIPSSGVSSGECELLGSEARKFSLDLEGEVEVEYRENESSPESSGKQDGGCEVGYFPQDNLSESSPSSRGDLDIKLDNAVELQFGPCETNIRAIRRRQTAFAKHKRMSLFAATMNPVSSIFNNPKSLFIGPSRNSTAPVRPGILAKNLVSEHKFETDRKMEFTTYETEASLAWQDDNGILKSIFVFLEEPDLLQSVSLVCTKWADVATLAHAELMLTNVGCTGLLSTDSEYDSDDDSSCDNSEDAPKYLDRSWDYLISTYPWARFLAEGGFKSVFKVYNHIHRTEEAVSVM